MKYNTKLLMMLNAGQKPVSMEGPAPRHLWNPQVGLVLGSQAPSLSLAASPTSLKAGTAAARLDLAAQFISNHPEAEGLQEASLTGFPTQCSRGGLRAELLQAAMLASRSDRGEAGVRSPSGVTQPSWLWPRQKRRVGAGPLQSPSRHFHVFIF